MPGTCKKYTRYKKYTSQRREAAALRFSTCVCIALRPAHALYFATYELSKDRLGGNLPGHHPLLTGGAGALATVVNDGVMTPADVIKQRLQVSHLLLQKNKMN